MAPARTTIATIRIRAMRRTSSAAPNNICSCQRCVIHNRSLCSIKVDCTNSCHTRHGISLLFTRKRKRMCPKTPRNLFPYPNSCFLRYAFFCFRFCPCGSWRRNEGCLDSGPRLSGLQVDKSVKVEAVEAVSVDLQFGSDLAVKIIPVPSPLRSGCAEARSSRNTRCRYRD